MGELWFGGTIYTMATEGDKVEAVYTENGLIIEVGTLTDLTSKFKNKITEKHNLDGSIMLPGFVDSHLHIIGHGEKLLRLDLSKLTSAEQVLDVLQEHVQQLNEGDWLLGEGWNENQWESPRIIHKSELDSVAPNHPVMLTRVCRHAVLANTKAMELAEVQKQTPNPRGGMIIRDEAGDTTGYFLDTAQELIKKVAPGVSSDYLTKLVKRSVADLHKYGLVGGHSEDLNYYGGFSKTLEAFKQAIHDENKFKAHLLVHHEVMDDMLEEELDFGDGSNYIELGAIKVFSDGALGGRTAWLSTPYHDDERNYGLAIHSVEALENIIKRSRQHGLPVAIHAIGDQAVWTVAQTIKKFPLNNGRRDRIIHAQIINEDVIQVLKSIDVVLDIQPTFVTSDYPWVLDRIGGNRAKDAYAWKTLVKNGLHCAAGSDAPIENPNPLLGIEAAVLRKSGIDGNIYNKEEQLTVYEAVSLYTKGSAYVIGREYERGMIAPGYSADFTVLNQDIFQLSPENISKTKVKMTVVDGTIVYKR